MQIIRPLLYRVLRIHPGELRPVSLLGLMIFAMMAGLEIVGNVAEIVFFRRVGVEHLPKLYSLEPLVMVTLLSFFGSFIDRLGRYPFLFGLNGLLIAGLLIARPLMFGGWEAIYPALWLAQRIFFGLAPLTFWVLCSDLFDIRQAKRLFTVLVGGGLAGATIGNLLTGLLSLRLVPEDILLAAVALFGLSLAATEGVRRLPVAGSHPHPDVLSEKKFSIGLPRRLLREPFLQALFLLMWIIGLLEPVLRYELNALANETFAAEQHLITFYGLLKAGAALLIVVFQLAVAGRLVERLGVPRTLSILPVGYILLLPILGLFTNIYVGAGVVAFLVTLSTGFHSPARTSVLNLFPAAERGRISAFTDQLWYIGWLTGSVFLIWAGGRLSLSGINFAAALVSATWLFILPTLRQRYARTCLSGAMLLFDQHRPAAVSQPVNGAAHERFRELLAGLRQDDEQYLALAVEGLKLPDPALTHSLQQALSRAGEAGQPHLLRALRSASWRVREGALRVLADHQSSPALMAEGVAAQVRHAFTLMALTAPLEDRFSASLWGKLRAETERACAAAALLLIELRYPAEQMRPIGRMIRSHLRATHATGLEALDNLVHLEGKRHLLALIGDLPLEEKRRYALRRLGIAGASGPEAALEQLAKFPDGLINFWARVETRRHFTSNDRRAPGRALALAQPAGPTVPLIAPLIFPEREDEALELAQKIETLRPTLIFGALSEEELKIIALCLREQRFEAAQVICEAGQSGEAVYILVEGRVELVTEAAPPRRKMLEPGEVFGEVALLAGEPYSLTAVTATRVALLSLDRETLRELIGYYPQIAGDLMRTLALRLNQANGSTQKEWL